MADKWLICRVSHTEGLEYYARVRPCDDLVQRTKERFSALTVMKKYFDPAAIEHVYYSTACEYFNPEWTIDLPDGSFGDCPLTEEIHKATIGGDWILMEADIPESWMLHTEADRMVFNAAGSVYFRARPKYGEGILMTATFDPAKMEEYLK